MHIIINSHVTKDVDERVAAAVGHRQGVAAEPNNVYVWIAGTKGLLVVPDAAQRCLV